MRRLLALAFSFLLVFIALQRSASTQKIPPKQLPDPSTFRPAGPTCQRRVNLSPWVGTPARGSNKFQCVLQLTLCGGQTVIAASEERESSEGMCADFWRVHAALTNREICCDEGSPNAKPSPSPSPQPTRCPSPLPWFGDSSKCKSAPKDPQITVSGGTATLYICGSPVFYHADKNLLDDLFAEAYRAGLRDHIKPRLRGKICCDAFEEAVRTGQPCNPKNDVDCDGKPNKRDLTDTIFPDIDSFLSPNSAAVDGYPVDYFEGPSSPPTSDCACRWELLKGELDCNPVQTGQHSYRSTWRCPSTGKQVVLTNYAPATSPCEE